MLPYGVAENDFRSGKLSSQAMGKCVHGEARVAGAERGLQRHSGHDPRRIGWILTFVGANVLPQRRQQTGFGFGQSNAQQRLKRRTERVSRR